MSTIVTRSSSGISYSARTSETDEALIGFSEEQLHFVADSLPQIAWTANPDGFNDYFNGRWFEYTQLTPQQTYEEKKSIVHPDDVERYEKSWEQARKNGSPYEAEYRFRRGSDGMYRWHLGRAHPVRDRSGSIVKWFGTCTDIHEQKREGEEMKAVNSQLEEMVRERTATLEQEVQERKITELKNLEHLRLLQRMINTLPMAAVGVNSGGKILHANESFRRFFAPSERGSIVDKYCRILLEETSKRLPSGGWEEFFRCLDAEESCTREVALRDGRTFAYDYIRSSRDFGGYLLLVRDISQEKKADAVKAEFMSLVSHQLRSPLTAIRWALSRLQKTLKGRLSNDEARLLVHAQQSATIMTQTIRTMLSISRIESGFVPLVPAVVSLKKFLQLSCEYFADSLRMKNLSLKIDCPEEISLNTDPMVLRELLENLISNAVKYTPERGSIVLRAKRERGEILIEVADTGIGIPAYQREKVFSKFFRGENALKIDTQGTGLGLYLVRRLADALGGDISFTSRQGKGTVFHLTLPDSEPRSDALLQ